MNFFFADDAKQNHPTRQGMGALVAIGGVCVPDSQIRYLESGLNALCMNYGFPPGEWFKWSPNKDQWMRTKLVEDGRQQFFVEAIELANSMGCKALVVIEDSTRSPVKKGLTATDDVTLMFIERVGIRLSYGGTDGIVIADRSFGAPDQEEEFLAGCLETIQQGTKFVTPERIALNVLSTPSRRVRTLQLADVVVSCTLSYISGEKAYSPPIFDHVKKRR